MNFGVIRVALTDRLRRDIPTDLVGSILPRAPENVNPPAIWLADGSASIDHTMSQRVWDWTVPLNIVVAHMRDYPREQEYAENVLAEIVPLIDETYTLEEELRDTGIKMYGLEMTTIEEGAIVVGSTALAGITINYSVKCKFPLTLRG
jgi:hypothetical protein